MCVRTTLLCARRPFFGRHEYSLTLGHSTTTTLHNIVRFAEYRETLPHICVRESVYARAGESASKSVVVVRSMLFGQRENTTNRSTTTGKSIIVRYILLSFSRLRLRNRVFVFLGRFRAHLQRVQPFLVEFLFQKRVHVSLSRHLFHAAKRLGDDV